MRWYSDCCFPLAMDCLLGLPRVRKLRAQTLAAARGDVLELGLGAGLNLPHYPPGVRRLVGVDPADVLPRRVARRVAALAFPVERLRVGAERLPLADASFDTVATTFTLCSVDDPAAALREARRVLRPDGRLLFLEHGLSDNPRVARWQHRLNPWQRWWGRGCNLNRPIVKLLEEAGFVAEHVARFELPWTPRWLGTISQGAMRAG